MNRKVAEVELGSQIEKYDLAGTISVHFLHSDSGMCIHVQDSIFRSSASGQCNTLSLLNVQCAFEKIGSATGTDSIWICPVAVILLAMPCVHSPAFVNH